MIALNASSSPFCSTSPPPFLREKGKNRVRELIRRLTKKAYIAWLFEPILYWVPSVRKNVWCMAVLGVRVIGSGHYRDEKFWFIWVWAWGSSETSTFCLELTPFFWQFWGFNRRCSLTAGSWPVMQQITLCDAVAQRQMMLLIPTIVLLYRRKFVPYSLTNH